MTLKELQNKLFTRFDFEEWKNILVEMFPKVEFFTRVNQVSHDLIKDGGQAGMIRLDDGRSLAIYTFEVNDNVLINRNRKGLREITARTIDQSVIHGVLAFYYSKNVSDYRLTFIAKQTSFNEDGELTKTETAPKRYTFLLGENEPCRTAAERLYELISKKKTSSIKLADVIDAFSVERLNKEFFAGYKAQYNKFLQQLSDNKQNRDYVKKLLGRLVFLQFLQKKGWMGVPASRPDWNDGDKNYLCHLIEHYNGNDRLLSDILEPLFFNTLNEKREGDIADARLGENIKIPYLNGGLFEKDNIDKLDIDFPYSYFKELMDFFAMYNFTIDENDPDDSEVGIDPEMLGHIFENLLEDNKDKGAFYTPKEIVQYMCRQSVIQYLKTHESDEQYTEAIEQLINNGIVLPVLQTNSMASRFMQLLKDVKVCDPAIGSGAFPMGILYVLYHAIHHLQSHAEPNKSFDSTQTKRDIIQNNIFGVDIEQGAVDIARLRFWLALVVDADAPQPLPNLDYKITCGNSLLSRYPIDAPIENVFVEYNKGKNESEKITLSKYKELVSNYTDTSSHETKKIFRQTIEAIKKAFKTELSRQEKDSISRLRGKILALEAPMLLGERTQKEKTELKKLKEQLVKKEELQTNIINNRLYADAFEWRFEFPQLLDEKGAFKGFDIVIGNPPYISAPSQIANEQLARQRKAIIDSKRFKSLYQKWDLYIPFIEFGMDQICKSGGLCTMIVPYPLTNQLYSKALRNMIITSFNLLEIVDLSGTKIFENATVSNCIPFIKKSQGCKTIISHIDKQLDIHHSFVKEYRDLIQGEKNYVWNLTQEERIGSRHPRLNVLGDYCYISKGMVLNADEKTAKGEFSKDDLISNQKDEAHPREYIEAKDIERYRIKNIRYLEYNTQRCPNKLSRPTFRELYENDKLMFNRLGQLQVMIDDKVHYLQSDSSFVAVRWCDLINVNNKSISSSIKKFSRYTRDEMEHLSKDVALRFILGIMNSTYATVLLRDLRGGDYHIYPEHIRNIPIPSVNNEQQQPIINLVDMILAAKRSDPNADTSLEERQIDCLVYHLYGLTYDEVLNVNPHPPITREEYEGE